MDYNIITSATISGICGRFLFPADYADKRRTDIQSGLAELKELMK